MHVNRKQTIKEALDDLGYKQYINSSFIVSTKGDEEVDVEFFTLEKYVTNDELRSEYKKRGLVPDVLAVITYLKDNPKFLDKKKHIGVQLEGKDFLAFYRWDDERRVYVGRNGSDWDGSWWFGGRRKTLDTGTLDTSTLGLLDRVTALEEDVEELRKFLVF